MKDPSVVPEDTMPPPSPAELVGETNDSMESPRDFSALVERSNDSSTKATPTDPSEPQITPSQTPPRSRSPLSRTHLRSRSLAAPPTAPFMTRAHSSPGVDSRGRYVDPTSQTSSTSAKTNDLPLRRSSPLRISMDEPADTVREQPGLHNSTPSSGMHLEVSYSPQVPSSATHNTFPRSIRRRPSSPLNPNSSNGGAWYTSNPIQLQPSQTSSSSTSSLYSSKFNEPHPAYSFSSGSSMPSTPSSFRSRSPSISSLETIPDIPDAEAAETEADQIARLKAAADKADADANNDMNQRQSAMDNSASSGTFGGLRFGGRADRGKRWSVCGAEGRHDLDLETIWED